MALCGLKWCSGVLTVIGSFEQLLVLFCCFLHIFAFFFLVLEGGSLWLFLVLDGSGGSGGSFWFVLVLGSSWWFYSGSW